MRENVLSGLVEFWCVKLCHLLSDSFHVHVRASHQRMNNKSMRKISSSPDLTQPRLSNVATNLARDVVFVIFFLTQSYK